MPVETPSLFADVIQDHLELKRKNAELEGDMPIDGYAVEDPFVNHPLFKTEEQARIERHTGREIPGSQSAGRLAEAVATHDEDGLWGRSRDFDWGD